MISGNATAAVSPRFGKLLVGFSSDLAGCVPTATLARNPGGLVVDPGAGSIVVAIEGNHVAVETYNASGAADALPFNLIVAC